MKTSLLTVAVAIAACGLAAGCGQNEQVSTTASTAVTSASPEATTTSTPPESPTATPSTTAPTMEPATPTGKDAAPSTPENAPAPTKKSTPAPRKTAAAAPAQGNLPQTDPGDYADAAVAAWSSGDTATLKKYVSSSATTNLKGAAPKGELLRSTCEDDMCSYTTEDGKRVTVTLDLDAVKKGKTGGITRVKVG